MSSDGWGHVPTLEVTMGNGTQPAGRRSERIHVRMAVALCIDSNGQKNEQAVSTVDLSNNGVRVYAKTRPRPGQPVAITTNSGHASSLRGRVVWIGPSGTSLEGQVGIEFLDPVSLPV